MGHKHNKDHHGHNHEHDHGHLRGARLGIAIGINLIITLSQIVGGVISGSLALLSDALHNFSDVIALIISYIAGKLASRSFSSQKTFGYKRAEILAAMINAATLVFIGGIIIYKAITRLMHPEPIDSTWVIALAVVSIIGNIICVLLLKSDADKNLNIRSAYLHLLTDVMTSIAVLAGGLAISLYQMYWIDSILSMLIALYLIHASWSILHETLNIVMQFAPSHLDIYEIEKELLKIIEIEGVHHLHLWQLDDKTINLEAHLDFSENIRISESGKILGTINKKMLEKFGINHTVFQLENGNHHDRGLLCSPGN